MGRCGTAPQFCCEEEVKMRRIRNRVVKLLVVAVVTAMMSPVSMSFAAVNNDEVTSQKIKEADGTSGQSTNSGSGVKTGHIQDGAVTDAKISGTISASKLGSHGHNASDIVGAINISNLPVGTTSGTVAAGAHTHDSSYQKKYGKIAVVAQSGGDYTDPVAAMNASSTWCGGASVTNPCLLKIMPGIYNIGTDILSMQSYIDVEGSGINTTKVVGVFDYSGTGETELRAISVEASSVGINMAYAGNNKLKGVSITVSSVGGRGVLSFAPYGQLKIEDMVINVSAANGMGIYSYSATGYPGSGQLILNNTTITAGGGSGFGIASDGFGPLFATGVDIVADFGISSTAPVTVKNSSIKTTIGLIQSDVAGGGGIKIANTLLDGPKIVSYLGINTLSDAKCFNLYDANYGVFTCQ